MAKKEETAEQKLLKMLEASAGPAAVAPKVEKQRKKQSVLSLLKIGNKLLIAGIIFAAVFLVGEILAGITYLDKNINFSVNPISAQRKSIESFFPTVEGLAFYLSGVKLRNIFQPYEKIIKNVISISDQNQEIVRRTQFLRLVGVSWLDSVESASVMIEDTDKQTTYFLQKGEKLGDIYIKNIYADSVELGYKNEEIIIQYDNSQL